MILNIANSENTNQIINFEKVNYQTKAISNFQNKSQIAEINNKMYNFI